jgi:hypothetical protein
MKEVSSGCAVLAGFRNRGANLIGTNMLLSLPVTLDKIVVILVILFNELHYSAVFEVIMQEDMLWGNENDIQHLEVVGIHSMDDNLNLLKQLYVWLSCLL